MANRHLANIVRLGPRIPVQVEEPQVMGRMESIMNLIVPDRVLAARQTDTTSAASAATTTSSCGPNACEKPTSNSTFTMPIILGVAIPVIGAAILFIILQRRHVRKQREEDANDRHASMDFGLGEVSQSRRSKRFPQPLGNEMDMTEKRRTRAGMSTRQVSMDMSDMRMANPYLLPPELQDSRESIHSLSRSIQQEDPYRPVTQYFPGDEASRPKSKQGSSIYTGSSIAPSKLGDKADLLSNASSPAQTSVPQVHIPPPRKHSIPQSNSSLSPIDPVPAYSAPPYPAEPPQAHIPETGAIQRKGLPASPHPAPVPAATDPEKQELEASNERPPSPIQNQGLAADVPDHRESYTSNNRSSNNYLAQLIMEREPSPPPPPRPQAPERQPNMAPPMNRNRGPPGPQNPRGGRGDRMDKGDRRGQGDRRDKTDRRDRGDRRDRDDKRGRGDKRDRGDKRERGPAPKNPPPNKSSARGQPAPYYVDGSEEYAEPDEYAQYQQYAQQYAQPQSGLTVPGYKKNRQSVGFRPLPPDAITEVDDPEIRANRIRSFYKEYFDESNKPAPAPAPAPQQPADPYYEEEDDYNFLGDAAYFDPETNQFVMGGAQSVTRRAMTPPPGPRFQGPPRGRAGSFGAMSAHSAKREPRVPPGPRAFSSASGRMEPRGRPGPKRPIAPPTPLNTLPTPSKLRDDSFAIMNSTDFAPPSTYRDRQMGRSESPLGEQRPYSPTVRAFTPTISAFEELAPMPSPHMLRKSGTFTSLDFAPPKKFRDPDSTSETGSIRSTGSGLSSAQLGAIRKGAYRVSRLPADVVGTKDDLATSLKPQWGMRAGS